MSERARPAQEVGEIFAVQQIGDYLQFTVVAPGIAAGFRPGHFVAVAVGGPNTSMVLRRAFAIYGATPTGTFAGTIQFVVAARGPGTRWLLERRPGERLDLVGPLGTPFPLPTGRSPAVLVGGGYGTAPLIPLAAQLLAAGSPVEMLIGAATGRRLFGELVAKRSIGAVTVTTDDGSAGHGRPSDRRAARRDPQRVRAEVVYACGPMPMLRAVGDDRPRARHPRAGRGRGGDGLRHRGVHDLRAAGRGEDGRSRFVRSCVDGPVFDASRVRWADIGTLPADLVGADAMVGGH